MSPIYTVHLTGLWTNQGLTSYSDRTYQILFAAARSPPAYLPPTPPSDPIASAQAPRHQSSLYAYWALPTPTSSAPRSPPQIHPTIIPICQDCDSPLLSTNDVDTCMSGMDDAGEAGEFACRACRRLVCGTCAVVEVGIGRECLSCKTQVGKNRRETWVGGIGWMP